MNHTDIYSSERQEINHSMRYISIRVNNVTGILNRIMSLMRRKRYNMEEVSVTFDRKHKKADIILAMDARVNDVNHVIQQIRKLYDVYTVLDITEEADKVFHILDVKLKSASVLKSFPRKPEKTVARGKKRYGLFFVPLSELQDFTAFLKKGKYEYGERVMGLI
jgi:acetolactate synthase small subunit